MVGETVSGQAFGFKLTLTICVATMSDNGEEREFKRVLIGKFKPCPAVKVEALEKNKENVPAPPKPPTGPGTERPPKKGPCWHHQNHLINHTDSF